MVLTLTQHRGRFSLHSRASNAANSVALVASKISLFVSIEMRELRKELRELEMRFTLPSVGRVEVSTLAPVGRVEVST